MLSSNGYELLAGARRAAAAAADDAARLDRETAFPADDVRRLAEAGLLTAPVPARAGGAGLGSDLLGSPLLLELLRLIGHASLPLGRLYEGHVNAWRLIARHGTGEQIDRLAHDAGAGHLFGVWNTDPGEPVRLVAEGGGWRLEGAKVLASGAGHVTRPLVTATAPDGAVRLLVVSVPVDPTRADLSAWQATGMRASLSGRFELGGLQMGPADLLGAPGAYQEQPDFTAGAWRFAAVQLGGIEAIVDAVGTHLRRLDRTRHPLQRARVGQMTLAAVTARLWLERAVALLAGEKAEPEALIAYVNLARTAVERAGLEVIELAQRSVGLAAFMAPHPLERLMRDLAVYLRQPNPDGALDQAAGFTLERAERIGELWVP